MNSIIKYIQKSKEENYSKINYRLLFCPGFISSLWGASSLAIKTMANITLSLSRALQVM